MGVYYHGTDIDSAIDICESIKLNKSLKYLDFGPGFYITDNKKSAERWALRKAKVRKKMPAIVLAEFDPLLAAEHIVEFDNDLRWGKFVVNNRNGFDYIDKVSFKEHNLDAKYDITHGRISDYYVNEISKELKDSGRELDKIDDILNPFYPYQYAFHTKRAIAFLKCLNYEIVKEA